MSFSSELLAPIEEDQSSTSSPVPAYDRDEIDRKLINAQEESPEITLGQRMISACSGSLVTSLVVTPFDVVRIRMQQQEIMPPDCCEAKSAPAPKSIHSVTTSTTEAIKQGSKRLTASPMVAVKETASAVASAAASTASAVTSPEIFWVSEKYCKSAENCSRINSTLDGFVTISRKEGLPTLWRGLSITLLMSIPSNIIYFTGYEYIRDHSPIGNHFLNPLLCGSLARTLSATFTSPLELIKTRLQAIPVEEKQNKMLSHLLKDLCKLVRQKGLSTLFTGLQITLWRDVPFSGIYWSCYEVSKSKIGSMLKANFDSNGDDDFKVFATSFLAGSISGSIAAFCTHPFDVGKTRLQITSEALSSKQKQALQKPPMFNFLITIFKNEGIGALYSGIYPRIMKVAPACAIMISSYEIGKKFFHKENVKLQPN